MLWLIRLRFCNADASIAKIRAPDKSWKIVEVSLTTFLATSAHHWLRPLLFAMYISPLSNGITAHSMPTTLLCTCPST